MPRVNRRTFLTGRSRLTTLELSCEQLYMRYSDARAEGRLREFLSALQRSIADAGDVRLTAPEWFAHDDFAADVGPLLRESIEQAAVRQT
jgi:hypothetical protein